MGREYMTEKGVLMGPAGILEKLRERMPPGPVEVLTHKDWLDYSPKLRDGLSRVYFVLVEKKVMKIGVSKRLASRLQNYKCSHLDVYLIAAFEGARSLETKIHHLLKEERYRGELFNSKEWRVNSFVEMLGKYGAEFAVAWLEETTPEVVARFNKEAQAEAIELERRLKREFEQRYTAAVADRKARVGW